MPTENERKYVLDMQFAQDLKDESLKFTERDRLLPEADPIQQAYLYGDVGLSVRIRGVYRKCPYFTMTVKQKIDSRTVEVEAEIPERDFNDLWEVSTEHLFKDRHILISHMDGKEFIWEIDLFFTEEGECYFVQAEHEMPEGQDKEMFIPDLIQQYLLYAVPRKYTGDFSSRKLSDSGYAEYMYVKLKK